MLAQNFLRMQGHKCVDTISFHQIVIVRAVGDDGVGQGTELSRRHQDFHGLDIRPVEWALKAAGDCSNERHHSASVRNHRWNQIG